MTTSQSNKMRATSLVALRITCLIAAACTMGATLELGFGRPHPKTYDFEDLHLGSIEGQKGWPSMRFPPERTEGRFRIVRGRGRDGTFVLARDGEGPDIIRQQDRFFSFKSIAGIERDAILQFDIRNGGPRWDAYFSAGGEMFGIGNGYFSLLRGGHLTTPAKLPPEVREGDWLQLRLHIDFAANNGRGAGTMEYRNLTRGDLDFRAIPELRNVQLWTQQATPRPWNVLHINMRSPLNGFAIDNLVPNMASPSYEMEKVLAASAAITILSGGALVFLTRKPA